MIKAHYDQVAFFPGTTQHLFTGRKGVFDYDVVLFPDLFWGWEEDGDGEVQVILPVSHQRSSADVGGVECPLAWLSAARSIILEGPLLEGRFVGASGLMHDHRSRSRYFRLFWTIWPRQMIGAGPTDVKPRHWLW